MVFVTGGMMVHLIVTAYYVDATYSDPGDARGLSVTGPVLRPRGPGVRPLRRWAAVGLVSGRSPIASYLSCSLARAGGGGAPQASEASWADSAVSYDTVSFAVGSPLARGLDPTHETFDYRSDQLPARSLS